MKAVEPRDVTITIKMVGIPVFDEELTVKDTTSLFAVKQHLVEKHGTTDELRLWRDRVEPTTILRNLNATVRDTYNLTGMASSTAPSSPNPRVTLFYEFGTPRGDCALLSAN